MNNNIVPWTPGRIPKEFVDRFALEEEEDREDDEDEKYWNVAPQSPKAMRSRILTFVSLMNGTLDSYHFVYGDDEDEKGTLSSWFCRALGDIAPSCRVRRLALDLDDIDQNHLHQVLMFLREARFLEEFLISDTTESTSASGRMIAEMLEALSNNTFIKLRFITVGHFKETHDQGDMVYYAFRRFGSLREVYIDSTSSAVATVICLALMCHPHLETVRVRGDESYTEALIGMLASLPKLKTVESDEMPPAIYQNFPFAVKNLTEAILSGGNNDVLVRVLRNARGLKTLDLDSFDDTGDVQFGTALSALVSLESLTMQSVDVSHLLQCSQLKTLIYSDQYSPGRGGLRTLLTQHPKLENLELDCPLSDARVCRLLGLIENNKNLTRLSYSSEEAVSEATKAQLRNTLRTKKNLKALQMTCDPGLVSVFADALQSDCCALESLYLEDHDVAPPILQALRNNSTLSTVSLDASFSSESWNLLKEMIHNNVHLKTLGIWCTGGPDSVNVDGLAAALNQNFTLTKIRLSNCGPVQAKVAFVCDLFSRRNRVKHMSMCGELTAETWPFMLHSLGSNASVLYLALSYFPFSDRQGKRKAQGEP